MNEFPKKVRVEIFFDIGEMVYVLTDGEQSKYTVMGYYVRPNEVLYEVYSHGYGNYIAYDFKLSREKDLT